MATRRTQATNVVGFSSVSFIRAQDIKFRCTGLKPNTRFFAFFDRKNVTEFCYQDGSSLGAPMISDAAGALSGVFKLPNNTFNTGTRVFRVSDSSILAEDMIPGSLVSVASAEFNAIGFQSTLQTTINELEIVTRRRELQTWSPQSLIITPAPPPAPAPAPVFISRAGDPLAQTFFTYGIKGGCFVTKIDIWFQSKDASIPISLELRHVENGYPAFNLINPYSSVVKNPIDVKISDDSSAVTTFEFSRPIYLEEDKDYCFVLLSNSNSYNVWTSELGGLSVETGKAISEQPFIGTMFKSENNITWNAHQTEDIKFRLYTAQFDTGVQRHLKLRAVAPIHNISGKNFSVTSSSPTVTAKFPVQHGFRNGDKFPLNAIPSCVYRGISAANLSKAHSVSVVDDYTFTFNVATPATSTGTLETNGRVNYVHIDNGGAGYSNPTATVTGTGSGATIELTVDGGVIVGATVTNMGSGYTSEPVITVSDSVGSSGSGAVLVADCTGMFSVSLNRKFQAFTPILSKFEPAGTELSATIRAAEVGTYALSDTRDINLDEVTNLERHNVLVNYVNEQSFFAAMPSTEFTLTFETTNPNVSPLVDLMKFPRLRLENNIVNDILSNPSSEFDPATELTPSSGTAYSRYISKPVTIATPSKGAKVIVSAMSVSDTWFDVYFRSSLSTAVGDHKAGNWMKMNCDADRNLSKTLGVNIDYNFMIDDLDQFDTYDIKIVLSSNNQYHYPVIDNYRVIIIAT